MNVVNAAKDPVVIPTEPAIVELAKRCCLHMALGADCFVLFDVNGNEREVSYNATLDEWTEIAERMLVKALEDMT